MATQTTRKQLTKPDGTDYVSRVNHFNANWEKIDDMTCYDDNEEITGVWAFKTGKLQIYDSDDSHKLSLAVSDITANRTLTLDVGNSDRTLTLNGNVTLGDWFDQSVKTSASPTFAGLTVGSLNGVVRASAGVLTTGIVDISNETNLGATNPVELVGDNVGLKFDVSDFELDVNGKLQIKDSGVDHGSLSGLSDDDHTQYLLKDGSRGLTGNWDAGDYKITAGSVDVDSDMNVGGNIYLEGTTWKRALTTSAGSKTIYVSASAGNDTTGDGTASNPYKTITKAISVLPRVVSEDTVIAVSPGTYNVNTDGQINTSGITVTKTLSIEARNLNGSKLYLDEPVLANIYSSTTIGRTTLSLEANSLAGGKVWIVSGTGSGQIRNIVSNTSTTITVDSAWDTVPGATSWFTFCGGVTITGSSVANIYNYTSNTYYRGLMLYNTANWIFIDNGTTCFIYSCYVEGYYGIATIATSYVFTRYIYFHITRDDLRCGIVLQGGTAGSYGCIFKGNTLYTNSAGIYVYMPGFVSLGTITEYNMTTFHTLGYGIYVIDWVAIRNKTLNVNYTNVTHKFYYGNQSFRDLYINSDKADPTIYLQNESDSEYDTKIVFQSGGSLNTKFVLGVDDSDGDKFKVALTALGTDDKFVISNIGRVGIGTSDPESLLNIVGGELQIGQTVDSYYTKLSANTLVFNRNNQSYVDQAGIGGSIVFRTSKTNPTDTVSLSVTSDGRVGVNTDSPVNKLTLRDSMQSVTLTDFTQAVNRAGLLIDVDYLADAYTPGVFWRTGNNNPTKPKAGIWMSEHGTGTRLYIGTSSSYATGITNRGIMLNEYGNVSIGSKVVSAAGLLEIQGNSTGNVYATIWNDNTAGAEMLAFSEFSGGTVRAWLRRYNSSHATYPNVFEIWQFNNADIRIGTNNTEYMRITSSGEVRIKNSLLLYDAGGNLTNAGLIRNTSPSNYSGAIFELKPASSNKYTVLNINADGSSNVPEQSSVRLGHGSMVGGEYFTVGTELVDDNWNNVGSNKVNSIYQWYFSGGSKAPIRFGYRPSNNTFEEIARFDTSGNLAIGTKTTDLALLTLRRSTSGNVLTVLDSAGSKSVFAVNNSSEMMLNYDSSKYLKMSVDSEGRTTLSTAGSANDAGLIIADAPYINTHTKPNHGLVLYMPFDEYRGDDLLVDGELDVWTSSTDLTNWTEDGVSSGVRDITQESTTKLSGSYSTKLQATSNDGSTDFGIYQNVTTVAGHSYEVIAYVRYASRTQGTVRLEAYNTSGGATITSSTSTTTGNYWYMMFIRFTAPSTSTRIMVYLDNETTGTLYIDRLSMRRYGSTDMYDHSVNAYKGVLNDCAIDATLFYGKPALVTNKNYTNSYVSMTCDDFIKTNAFTAEFWYRQYDTDFPYGSGAFGWNPSNPMIGFHIAYVYQRPILYMGNNNYRYFTNSTPTDITDGNWHHVVVTLPGAYQNAILSSTMWVDGKLQTVYADSYAGTQATKTTTFTIGCCGTSYQSLGAFAEFKLYNRVLTPSEIRSHYLRVEDHHAVRASRFRVIDNVSNTTSLAVINNNVGILTDSPATGLDINSNSIRIRTSKTPSGSGDGNVGDICWDNNYLYVKVDSTTWKRVALSSL